MASLLSGVAAGQALPPGPQAGRRLPLRRTPPMPPMLYAAPVAARPIALRPRPAPKEPLPPVGPTPDVRLALEAPTLHGTWTMRVTNDGDIPVRLVADARLLTLEVTPRGAANALRCELPADMRPGDDTDRPLVLPPGRSYVERFEPRLYCFGKRLLDALAEGSIVVAHLGWTDARTLRPPFEVQSIAGVEPELAPLREIASPPIALWGDPTPSPYIPPPARPDDPDPTSLAIRGPVAVDALSPEGISVNVTLHNAGKRPVEVRFRPETLRFMATGPGGVEDCRWPMRPVAPMRELFTRVPPGGTTDLTVLLDAYCAGRTLDRAGLLVLRPELDTRKASGAEVGLRTFDGRVAATTDTVVRLHQGAKARSLQQPHIEPLPSPPVTTATLSAAPGAPTTIPAAPPPTP